jgi:hypothetical protein
VRGGVCVTGADIHTWDRVTTSSQCAAARHTVECGLWAAAGLLHAAFLQVKVTLRGGTLPVLYLSMLLGAARLGGCCVCISPFLGCFVGAPVCPDPAPLPAACL